MKPLLKLFLFALPVFILFLGNVTLHAQEADPSPDMFINVAQEPKPLNMDEIKRKIAYPEDMRLAQTQGKVIVKLLIDTLGIPRNHIIKRTPHRLLTEAVEKVIYDIRFTPAIKEGGKKIKFWVSIPFDFKLKGNEQKNLRLPPLFLNREELTAAIQYPKKCKRKKIEGSVKVLFHLDKAGNVLTYYIQSSPHPLMTEEVEKHISKVRFAPGREGEVLMPAHTEIEFPFTLPKK